MPNRPLDVFQLRPMLRPGTSHTANTQRISGNVPTVSLCLLRLYLIGHGGFTTTQHRWISWEY
jgi:hypothetical protein